MIMYNVMTLIVVLNNCDFVCFLYIVLLQKCVT